jgi:exopolysaccharide biosynthesis polyprenyl glycosylphosphotransferase
MGTKLAETQAIREAIAGHVAAGAAAQRARRATRLKQKTVKRALFVAADALALLLSNWAAEVAVQHSLGVPGKELTPPGYMLFYLPFLLGIFYLLERSQSHELRRPEKELELAVKGVSYAFLLLVCANFVVFKSGFSRYLMVSWYVLSLATVPVARYGIRVFYGRLWERGLARRRTLLVGSAEKLFELETLLAIQRYRAYEIIGILPAGNSPPVNGSGHALPVMGSLDQWREVAEENGVEQVIVALPSAGTEAHHLVPSVLQHCLAAGIDVQVYSDLFASREFNHELDEFSGFFRFYAAARWSKKIQLIAKSVLDKLAGLVGSLITLLILPVVALLIKIEDGGPVFYKREYFGRDHKAHYDLKLRTMRATADEILRSDPDLWARYVATEKLANDPRVLRVGRLLRKYSIDELPQFFSVLTGELALVGPRVISRDAARRYGERLPKLFSVKPGLTGFWQVMGRQLTTYEERVQMDMFYIDHWSIWLDLWIVIKTFWKVLRAEGAY